MTGALENDACWELLSLERYWAHAIVQNDADRIAQFLSDDWAIIGPQGNVIERTRFLGVIKSGDLSQCNDV